MTLHEQTWDLLEAVVANITYDDGSRFQLVRDDESNYAVLYVFLHAPTDRPRRRHARSDGRPRSFRSVGADPRE